MTELSKEFAPTGTLRASLNMGNPVLARSNTSKETPAGVTIDLARAFARELGVDVEFLQFETAAQSVAALADGNADIGFMAIDPLRAETTHFTPAYVQIEGAYLVPADSPIRSNDEVDRAGISIVVGQGSAYGLYLGRNIKERDAGAGAHVGRSGRHDAAREAAGGGRREAGPASRCEARWRPAPARGTFHGHQPGDGHAQGTQRRGRGLPR